MQPNPAPSPPPARRPADWLPHALGLLAAALLLALLLALMVGLSAWQERNRQHQRAAAAAQNLARLLEARVAEVLVKADLLLQAAAVLASDTDGRAAEGAGLAAPANAPSSAPAAALPDVLSGLQDLRLADADGRWRWRLGPASPGRPPDAPADLPAYPPDSEELQRTRAPAAPGLVITGPRRHSPDGPWLLVLSRAVHGADGRFAGLLSGDLPVARFDALLGAIDLGEHGAAALRTESMALVYRWPAPVAAPAPAAAAGDAAIGSTSVPAALREAIALNPLAGEFDAPAAPDGSPRIGAYRQVLGYPLIVLLDQPDGAAPAGWGAVQTAIAALALATLALAGLAGGLLLRAGQRQQRAAQRQWADLVDASTDAIVSETLDGVLTHWNPAAERLFGHSAAQMLGQSVQRLVPPEQRDQLAQAVAQVARGEPVSPFETERLCRDGRRIAVLISVAPLTAPDGRVTGSTRTARDLTPQQALQAELRQLAFYDPLTLLPNRRLLLDRLGRAQQASRRLGSFAALLVIEWDRVTPTPGRLGPDAEDDLRLHVAQRLVACVRETDTVARLGDAVFAVVCENLGAGALLAGQRLDALEAKLRSALAQPMPLSAAPGAGPVSCRLHIGRRLFIGTDSTPAALIYDADRTLDRPPQRQAAPGAAPQDDVNEDDDDY